MVDKSSRTPSNGGRSQSSESTDDSTGKKEPNKGPEKANGIIGTSFTVMIAWIQASARRWTANGQSNTRAWSCSAAVARATPGRGFRLLGTLLELLAFRKAIETDGSHREVVVKMLHAPFHSPAAAKYTLRELVLLSSLKHPNVGKCQLLTFAKIIY